MSNEDRDLEIAGLRARIAELEAPFANHAAAAGVPVQAVIDAAAHTFDKLDVDDQVSLVEESLARWQSHQEMVVQTGLVVATRPNQMRDDLVYRLQHENFDLVYAMCFRHKDAASGGENAHWLMTPPRPGEDETPPERSIASMAALVEAMRRGRQKFESVLTMQRAKLHGARRVG
jgi:hypothetical protein